MKVAIVSNGIPVSDSPLLGIFELDQAKAIKKQGVDVTLLCVDLRSVRHKRKLGLDNGVTDGIKWYRYAFPLGNVPIEIYRAIGRYIFKLLYDNVYGSGLSPDIIHAHFYDMGIIAGRVANEKGIPLVITEHSSQVAKPIIGRRLKKEIKNGYKRANVVIAVSEGLRKRIHDHTGVNAIVINNVVDMSMYECVRVEHEGFGIVMTANMLPGKNPLALLEAFYRLHSIDNNCYLGFVGDGPERSVLEKRVNELGIQELVIFYGRRDRSEYSKIYSKFDCFVLPSNAETFGMVIIEAFACGLPCIVSRCGGPEYIVKDFNGIIVEPQNIEELFRALRELKNNISSYNPEEIIAYVKDNYSEEVIGIQLMKLYTELVEGKDV